MSDSSKIALTIYVTFSYMAGLVILHSVNGLEMPAQPDWFNYGLTAMAWLLSPIWVGLGIIGLSLIFIGMAIVELP